jgi:drug/metabolite transporter (DMT)-like permease
MEPGVETVGVAKPRQVAPGGHQRVLDRVSRELAIPEDQAGRSVRPRDGRANERRKGVMIASLCPFDETPLVHCRPHLGATTRCARMVCRMARADRSRRTLLAGTSAAPTLSVGFCEDRPCDTALGTAPMTRRGLVLFALMSVIWGIPYLFIRVAVAEISPATLVFARTAIATVILLPLALLRTDLRPVLRRWRWLVAFAAVEVAIPWVLLSSAEQRISSSLAGLLVAGVPLVGTVFAIATRGTDRLGPSGPLGLLIGFVGVAAIIGADVGTTDLLALLQVGGVVVGYAVGPAILARRLVGLSSLGIMAVSLAMSAVLYAPIAAAQWPSAVPSGNALGAIAILGVVCTAAAFLLFAALIGEIGPVRATLITYVNPAVAALLGVLVLQESFTVPMALGFVLVIAGSALATRPRQAAAAADGAHVEPSRASTGA